MKQEKREILNKITKNKELLKFSEVWKILPEDEKFAKEQFDFLSQSRSGLFNAYSPETVELNIQKSTTKEDLEFFEKQLSLIDDHYQELTVELSWMHTDILERRKIISNRNVSITKVVEEVKTVEEITVVEEVKTVEEITVVEEVKTVEEITVVEEVKVVEEIKTVEEITVVEEAKIVEEDRNQLVIDGSIALNAKILEYNGYVELTWNTFNVTDEVFKYYKVVHSANNSNPIYPDNGFIRVISNISTTLHKDYKSKDGMNYYRICVVTQRENRYCSNVVKIENEIAQKVENKKDEFSGRVDILETRRDVLLSQKEDINSQLNFSNLNGVNSQDNYFIEEKGNKLRLHGERLSWYAFNSARDNISQITKISEFDHFHVKLDGTDRELADIGESLEKIQNQVHEKKLEIENRMILNNETNTYTMTDSNTNTYTTTTDTGTNKNTMTQ